MSSETRPQPKVSLPLIASALAASLLLGWVAYKAGMYNLAHQRASMAAQREAYLQGALIGSFLPPCVVALIALAFKGRSARRCLLAYTVTAWVVAMAMLSTATAW